MDSLTIYSNGRISFFDVLQPEQEFTHVAAILAVTESKLVTDQINLFLSLGGGWG